MALEIERKFLVKNDNWRNLGEKKFYQQAYLIISESKTIRIRTIDQKAFLTIKSSSKGFTRNEFEYEIPVEEAKEMIEKLCEKPAIEKYRTKILIEGFTWEIDEFIGENEGLILAEIELSSEKQSFNIPEWIGDEVTSNYRYNNSYLVKHPFSKWTNDNDK